MHLILFVASVTVVIGAGAFVSSAPLHAPVPAAQPVVNETARLLADFRSRVDKYVELRKKAAKDGPRLKETTDPAAIKTAQESLATHIRTLRADARPGDIFTTEIRPVFRRLLAPEMKGEKGRETKATIAEDGPPSVPLKINAKYPEAAPLPTVPANILASLPPLPKEVEYRLVGRNLLLFDPEAEIIVDYLANAIAK